MKTISDLNSLNSLSEAELYLDKHFKWSDENSTVADFMNLLYRRFQ